MCKRVYDFPAPHLSLIISSWGADEPQLTTKTHKRQNKPIYIKSKIQIQNTTSPNLQKDYTYMHNQHHQQGNYTKLKTPLKQNTTPKHINKYLQHKSIPQTHHRQTQIKQNNTEKG